MQAKISRRDHYAIISYTGDTVGLMPGPLPEVLSALQMGGVQEIILELSELTFLNPSGAKAIKESVEIARRQEVNIGIAAPPPGVRRALKISGLGDIPIYYNENEAVAKLDLIDYQETAKAELSDRLLICQKDLPLAGALRTAFKNHPLHPQFRMVPVRELKRAFQVLLEEKIDCILIESSFPLFQITSFIEQVSTDTRVPCIPIIIVTQDEHLNEADLIIRNGAQDILRYPFQPVEAAVRIQTLISHLKDHTPHIPIGKVVQPRGYRS